MDSFEWNKIAGAILFALLIGFGLQILSETLFETEAPEHPGYVIAVAEATPSGGEKAAALPIGVLLASADVKSGEGSAKKCSACHDYTKGGPNRTGPNLWGVVGRPIAAHEGFAYSDAMMKFSDNHQKHWDFDQLNAFLTDPKAHVPGTKMGFAGLKQDPERANVIAFLNTQSDSPLPPPEVAAAAPAAAAAPTDAAAKPAGDAAAPAAAGAAAPAAGGAAAPAGGAAQPAGQAPAAQPAPATQPAVPATAPQGSAAAPALDDTTPDQQPGQAKPQVQPIEQPAAEPAPAAPAAEPASTDQPGAPAATTEQPAAPAATTEQPATPAEQLAAPATEQPAAPAQ